MFKQFMRSFALLALIGTAAAQGFPSKPLRVVVPFPPGGPLDGMARAVSQVASPAIGQPIVVDNRPGALGTIGTENVARSPADGYTVLAGFSGGHSVTPAIMNLRFEPERELPPLMGVAVSEMVVVVNPKHKGKSLQDFVKFAKSQKEITIGSIGIGSTNHLVGELFRRTAGFQATNVPYQGAAPLSLAVMAGEVEMAVLDVGAVLAHVEAGKLVPLAVASARRSEFLPTVTTFEEAGFPGVVSQNVYCLFVRAGTPVEIQDILRGVFSQAIQSDSVKAQLAKMGLKAAALPASEVSSLINRQRDILVPVARELKIRIE